MINRFLSSLLIVLSFVNFNFAQCNLYPELCNKKYDEVAYLTTHNAFNASEDGFTLGNHTFGLERQLNDGVRSLMLDVYDENGVATMYHGFSALGTMTLYDGLEIIKAFLDNNPNEVITIIFESYVNSDLIESDLESAGLIDELFVKDENSDWPTLQEMIDLQKRLVVFSDRTADSPGQEWHHYVWDYAVETHFSNHSLASFTCDYNRGNAENDLFILNHFVTDEQLGVGEIDSSALANDNPFLINRAMECQEINNKFPNFVTVDFYELGNAFDAVNILNEVSFVSEVKESDVKEIKIFPNPTNGTFMLTLDSGDLSNYSIEIYDSFGKTRNYKSSINNSNLQIFVPNKGIYSIRLTNKFSKKSILKRIIVI